jgi:hypothetical protein
LTRAELARRAAQAKTLQKLEAAERIAAACQELIAGRKP